MNAAINCFKELYFLAFESKVSLYEKRFILKYFSFYLATSNQLNKLAFLICLVIYSAISFTIYFLIKQRMSVPEFKAQKYKSSLYLVLSIFLIFISLFMVFNYRSSLNVSKEKLLIVDNITVCIFMVLSLIVCWIIRENIVIISRVSDSEKKPIFMSIQLGLLLFMTVVFIICKLVFYL